MHKQSAVACDLCILSDRLLVLQPDAFSKTFINTGCTMVSTHAILPVFWK